MRGCSGNAGYPHCFRDSDKCNCCGLERKRGSPI